MSGKIGEELKELRIKLHISQEQLQELSGVSKLSIRRIECGLTKNPKLETVEKIENALLAQQKKQEEKAIKSGKIKKKPIEIFANQQIKAIISYETRAEAIIDIEEIIIDEENHITQRKYGKPEIKKVLSYNTEKYKIIKTMEEYEIQPPHA